MSEIDKLEEYLKEVGANYTRQDQDEKRDEDGLIMQTEAHQIIVFDEKDKRQWDAICCFGSYGYERGLLEVMGKIVEKSGDVVGWLTAEQIINALNTGERL